MKHLIPDSSGKLWTTCEQVDKGHEIELSFIQNIQPRERTLKDNTNYMFHVKRYT